MKSIWVFLDVDGTLMGKDNELRPHIHELFQGIVDLGGGVIIWTGGGRDHAERLLCRLPPRTQMLVSAARDKGDPGLLMLRGQRFAVDDMKDVPETFKKIGHGGYVVPFFEPHITTNDHALLDALQAIREFAQTIEEDAA